MDVDSIKILPYRVHNGLAVYRFGMSDAPAVLFMPGPHRFQNPSESTAQSLIRGFVRLGYQVVSFDPPGSGYSTRPCHLSMTEMHDCANEALGIAVGDSDGKVIGVGHSMGGMAMLAFTLDFPQRIDRLILVCTGSGGPAYMKARGALWNRSHSSFFKLAILGILHMCIPNLALQKHMMNFINRHSYVNPRYVPHEKVEWRDWFHWKRGHSSDWHCIARKLDYSGILNEVEVRTLVIGTRHDVQFPLSCSQELHQGILNSKLAILERSGHFPFIEEPIEFWDTVAAFIKQECIYRGRV